MPSRERVAEVALAQVGLSADPSTGTRESYVQLVAPGESAQMVAAMLTMSGCGLVVAGIWRKVGLEHELLSPPYKIGHAIVRLITVAKQSGAWKVYAKGDFPSIGDMVLVGDGSPSGGIEHVYTVVETDSLNRTLITVDGGQKTVKGFQTVLKKQRTWATGRDVVFNGTDPGSRAVGGRKIIGVIDVLKLPWDIYT